MSQEQIRRQAGLTVQRRASSVRSYDKAARTVELVAATRTRVLRYDWNIGRYYEELDIAAGAIDLARVLAGQCPLLDTHSRWSVEDQLGTTDEARVDADELITKVRFGNSDRAKSAEADVEADVLSGVSIGYRVDELTLIEKDGDTPVYRATKWALLEVSLCPVPADPAAGVRSENGLHPCVILETRKMPPENEPTGTPAAQPEIRTPAAAPAAAPAGETRAQPAAAPAVVTVDASAARMAVGEALDFVAQARAFGVDEAEARKWAEGETPEAARSKLLNAAAEKQRGQAPTAPAQSGARVGQEERDVMRSAMPAALLHRYDPTRFKLEGDLGGAARQYMAMSLMEMARFHLEANGEKVRGLTKRELADMALSRASSTSDFPSILANVANKTLRDNYTASPQTFRAWQRRVTAPDFKQIQRTQLGDAPALLQVPEGGQFKMGTIGEGKEVYALATYGRIFSITRQTLINDDLDAFTRVPELMGRAAADFESDAAYAPLIANPNMGDGTALFHANHGNLAGAGAAIAEATVQSGEVAMMSQTGLGGRPIAAGPKFMIVSAKDKVPAQKLLSAVQASATSGVNVYANSMDLVVEVRLNRAAGATPWYMAADPRAVDTIEYAYLEGEEGVYMEERRGFETDGMDFKVRLDFAVKAIDWRGLYQNPGT